MQEGLVIVSRFTKEQVQVTQLGLAPELLAPVGQALNGLKLDKLNAGEKVTLVFMNPGDIYEFAPVTADSAPQEMVPYNLSLDTTRLDALRQLVTGTAGTKTVNVEPGATIRVVAQK
ncbi:hypothetical protein [Streptomyces sp. BPTC-684]|uniref:hypothetical protein n=1 Tax=Streptomyces sp. BPTC-684 TaxID=3043734 RepID=UPI0024B1461A|nr:hypothetical protein [Streptomyces sp. BPTC-684]WHM36722.1 hypothetical protein QIY60_07070 [Streptomyces sp. BPTC-684]